MRINNNCGTFVRVRAISARVMLYMYMQEDTDITVVTELLFIELLMDVCMSSSNMLCYCLCGVLLIVVMILSCTSTRML